MKLYLAGPCDSEHRTLMTHIANWIEANTAYEVYRPWELKIENTWDYTQEDWARRVFEADVDAIIASDIIISVSFGRVSSAGTNWEQGYAYGIRKPIGVIQIGGDSTSLMTYCGCSMFINSDEDIEHINLRIKRLLDGMNYNVGSDKCTTVLT